MKTKERNKNTWYDVHVLLRSDDYIELVRLAKADQRKSAVFCRLLIERALRSVAGTTV